MRWLPLALLLYATPARAGAPTDGLADPVEVSSKADAALRERIQAAAVENDTVAMEFRSTVHGLTAVMQYKYMPDGNIVVIHTEVPPSLRGNGFATRLGDAAVAFAREKGLKIYPICKFMLAYLRRHTEHLDIVHPVARRRYKIG